MQIKIYQINTDRDSEHAKFIGLQERGQSEKIKLEIYDEVYSGDVDCRTLEDVYALCNLNHPLFYRGHSLGVSDVVEVAEAPEVKPGFYYCDSFGFKEIEFDPALTQKPGNLLQIVAKEPGKPAYETEVTDNLKALQQAVRGNIETFSPFEDNALIICNEEGKINGMELNCVIDSELLVGTILVIGCGDEGEFCSLTEEQSNYYLDMFKQMEIAAAEFLSHDGGMSMT
ncbi:MAG: YodL domain-containing protein [Oscillospiraceae bacterium]|nr:YodL domain-containing protein [Oscillospiraceae bacterium]